MRTPKIRFVAAFAAFAAICSSAAAAAAASYPDHQIWLVVPFAAGASMDAVGRAVAKGLSDELKQPVLVSNRPGANTIIGTTYAARAKPDGYTILLASSSQLVNEVGTTPLPYKFLNDFESITQVSSVPYVLTVSNDSKIKSVADLIVYSKKNEITFGVVGLGPLLAADQFHDEVKMTIKPVQYSGGAGTVTVDMIGGRIDYTWSSISAVAELCQTGKLRCIATTASKRLTVLPNVPTLHELGYKDYDGFTGLVAPKGLSRDVYRTLFETTRKVLRKPEVIRAMETAGHNPNAGDSFDTMLKEQFRIMTVLAKKRTLVNP